MKPPPGAFIQFACVADQTAKNISETGRNSMFTKHLLGCITQENTHIADIFQHIVDDVYQESGRKQKPSFMNRLHQHQQVYLNAVASKLERSCIKYSTLVSYELIKLLMNS
jgi:hypothetical protein